MDWELVRSKHGESLALRPYREMEIDALKKKRLENDPKIWDLQKQIRDSKDRKDKVQETRRLLDKEADELIHIALDVVLEKEDILIADLNEQIEKIRMETAELESYDLSLRFWKTYEKFRRARYRNNDRIELLPLTPQKFYLQPGVSNEPVNWRE